MKDIEIDIIVGGNFRFMRIYRNMSQETVGNFLDITFQQVQKYERGANRMSASKLYKAGILLDCHVGAFFRGLPAV